MGCSGKVCRNDLNKCFLSVITCTTACKCQLAILPLDCVQTPEELSGLTLKDLQTILRELERQEYVLSRHICDLKCPFLAGVNDINDMRYSQMNKQ